MVTQHIWLKSGIKLIATIAILVAGTFLSSTPTQAFTLVDRASHLDVFSPVTLSRTQTARLNAANVLCDGSVRVLFKFFDSEGNTLMEETKSLACGQAASSELTTPQTDVANRAVYGIVAVLIDFRPEDRGEPSTGGSRLGGSSSPIVTLLEVIDASSSGDGSVRLAFLPAVQRSNVRSQ